MGNDLAADGPPTHHRKRRRTRRSNKKSKETRRIPITSNTVYYSIYSGYRHQGQPIFFRRHSEALSWGLGLAKRDGVLRAHQLTTEDAAIEAIEDALLDYIGMANVDPDQVVTKQCATKSGNERSFFSALPFLVLSPASPRVVKSTHIRLDRDLIRQVLRTFHMRPDFHHSGHSIYGKGRCLSINSLRLRSPHCPVMSSSMDPSDGLIKIDKKCHYHKNDDYKTNGEMNYLALMIFLLALSLC